MIEVEVRCFVPPIRVEELRSKLSSEARFKSRSRQVTYYLSTEVDTRIQLSSEGGRIWQKLGNLHDPVRQEAEVRVENAVAKELLEMLGRLGIGTRVAWYRVRETFSYLGLDVSLDHTVGYGWILEVERLCQPGDGVARALEEARSALSTLGLEESPKGVFESAFSAYLREWQDRTAHLDESWIQGGAQE